MATFLRPGAETADGALRAEVVLAYLVHHPDGLVLLDTGMGQRADVDAHYRPHRQDLHAVLARHGVVPADIRLVMNCHLHFDHCGGNALFPDVPILAQREELRLASEPGHTLPGLIDFPRAKYEPLDGAAEPLPGLHVLATPGHTSGHQSLAVRDQDGTVLLAGQALEHASDFTAAVLARERSHDGDSQPLPPFPPWLEAVLALDPRRVVFAHDEAVWVP